MGLVISLRMKVSNSKKLPWFFKHLQMCHFSFQAKYAINASKFLVFVPEDEHFEN